MFFTLPERLSETLGKDFILAEPVASEYDSSYAYRRYMHYGNEDVNYDNYSKILLFSVRCVQD